MKPRHLRAKRIDLAKFANGTARLSKEFCQYAAAAAALKLKQHSHNQPANLSVDGSFNETISVVWSDPDPRNTTTFANNATELAGECIGIALCEKLTDFNVVERSYIGTGFDFWLGRKRDRLFQRKARLEISATDAGGLREIDARVKAKQRQTQQGSGSGIGVALIVVSDFSMPASRVVKHA
jgi:hypothetical protein